MLSFVRRMGFPYVVDLGNQHIFSIADDFLTRFPDLRRGFVTDDVALRSGYLFFREPNALYVAFREPEPAIEAALRWSSSVVQYLP